MQARRTDALLRRLLAGACTSIAFDDARRLLEARGFDERHERRLLTWLTEPVALLQGIHHRRFTPPNTTPGRYRPPDPLLAFFDTL